MVRCTFRSKKKSVHSFVVRSQHTSKAIRSAAPDIPPLLPLSARRTTWSNPFRTATIRDTESSTGPKTGATRTAPLSKCGDARTCS